MCIYGIIYYPSVLSAFKIFFIPLESAKIFLSIQVI